MHYIGISCVAACVCCEILRQCYGHGKFHPSKQTMFSDFPYLICIQMKLSKYVC